MKLTNHVARSAPFLAEHGRFASRVFTAAMEPGRVRCYAELDGRSVLDEI